MNSDSGMDPGMRHPTSTAHVWSAVGILAGAVLTFLPASLFGTYLGSSPNRMACTPETGYGSGCDEGELMIGLTLFGVIFLFCAAFSFALTKAYRYNLPPWRRWLPFGVFCIIVLITVAVSAFVMGAAPGQYL